LGQSRIPCEDCIAYDKARAGSPPSTTFSAQKGGSKSSSSESSSSSTSSKKESSESSTKSSSSSKETTKETVDCPYITKYDQPVKYDLFPEPLDYDKPEGCCLKCHDTPSKLLLLLDQHESLMSRVQELGLPYKDEEMSFEEILLSRTEQDSM